MVLRPAAHPASAGGMAAQRCTAGFVAPDALTFEFLHYTFANNFR
jgi:hypothetical protein